MIFKGGVHSLPATPGFALGLQRCGRLVRAIPAESERESEKNEKERGERERKKLREKIEGRLKGEFLWRIAEQGETSYEKELDQKKNTPRASISAKKGQNFPPIYTQTRRASLPFLYFFFFFSPSLSLSSHSTPDFAKVLQQPRVLGLKGCADE